MSRARHSRAAITRERLLTPSALRMPAGAAFVKEGMGRIAVLGSVQVFDDKWIDKEENSKLLDFVFKLLRPVRASKENLTYPWQCCTHQHSTAQPAQRISAARMVHLSERVVLQPLLAVAGLLQGCCSLS
jgi:hypothetical protein